MMSEMERYAALIFGIISLFLEEEADAKYCYSYRRNSRVFCKGYKCCGGEDGCCKSYTGDSVGLIVGPVCAGFAVIIVMVCVCICIRYKQRQARAIMTTGPGGTTIVQSNNQMTMQGYSHPAMQQPGYGAQPVSYGAQPVGYGAPLTAGYSKPMGYGNPAFPPSGY